MISNSDQRPWAIAEYIQQSLFVSNSHTIQTLKYLSAFWKQKIPSRLKKVRKDQFLELLCDKQLSRETHKTTKYYRMKKEAWSQIKPMSWRHRNLCDTKLKDFLGTANHILTSNHPPSNYRIQQIKWSPTKVNQLSNVVKPQQLKEK